MKKLLSPLRPQVDKTQQVFNVGDIVVVNCCKFPIGHYLIVGNLEKKYHYLALALGYTLTQKIHTTFLQSRWDKYV